MRLNILQEIIKNHLLIAYISIQIWWLNVGIQEELKQLDQSKDVYFVHIVYLNVLEKFVQDELLIVVYTTFICNNAPDSSYIIIFISFINQMSMNRIINTTTNDTNQKNNNDEFRSSSTFFLAKMSTFYCSIRSFSRHTSI